MPGMFELQERMIDALSYIERIAQIMRYSKGMLREGDADIIKRDLNSINAIIRETLPLWLTDQELDNEVRSHQKHLKFEGRG